MCVAGSLGLKDPTHSMKLFMRRFSKMPISGDRRASAASDGTLATVALEPDPCCT